MNLPTVSGGSNSNPTSNNQSNAHLLLGGGGGGSGRLHSPMGSTLPMFPCMLPEAVLQIIRCIKVRETFFFFDFLSIIDNVNSTDFYFCIL